jgi:hypothetical protein
MFGVDEIFLKTRAFRSFQISHETSIAKEARAFLCLLLFLDHIPPPFFDRVKSGPILGLNVKKTEP